MRAATDGAAEHGSASDPFRSVQTLDAVPSPAAARPGTVKRQLAAETLRLYTGDWMYFQTYCAVRGRAALPARPELVDAFLAVPGVRSRCPGRRLAAIDHQHRQHGLRRPCTEPSVRAVLRQTRRNAPRQTHAAAPDSATLIRMADACRGDLAGDRDRGLLQLLAAGLRRPAIVVLEAEQLRFTEPGLDVTVSGNDQTSKMLHFPRSAAPAPCPVRAVED